ncbi:hypothetical protein KC218_28115, partial [Mycobacterium tuberculosis]|nr:hypothetical protein [Mycobacterium tuberculosis]
SLQVAAEDVDPAGELDRARRRAIAYAAIRRMDPAQRRLMLQAYLRAESRESLARGHGLPTGTVKTHLRRSLLALRHTIQ